MLKLLHMIDCTYTHIIETVMELSIDEIKEKFKNNIELSLTAGFFLQSMFFSLDFFRAR